MKRAPLGKLAPGAPESAIVARLGTPVPRATKPEVPKVTVPADLRNAPDAIRRLGMALGGGKKDEHERLVVAGARQPLVAVTIATHRRALLILAGLASAMQQRGHSVVFRDDSGANGLSLVLGDHVLGISVVERLEQMDHVLTPDEERRSATGYRYGIPKHDHFAGGRLQLLLHDTRGARTSWSDTKIRKLDQQLGAVILAAESELQRRQEQWLADEQRRKEEARRRAEEDEERTRQRLREARAKYQERLVEDLRRMARAWSDAEEIRRFLSAVHTALPRVTQADRTTKWLRWADSYTKALDPMARLDEIPKELEPTEEQLRER